MNAWRHAAPLIALGVLATDGCSAASSEDASPSGFGGDSPENTGSSSSGGSGGRHRRWLGQQQRRVDLAPRDEGREQVQGARGHGELRLDREPHERPRRVHQRHDVQRPDDPGGQRPHLPGGRCPTATDDVAVVLNVLSEDATLLRVDPQGALTTQTYASTADANSWAISSSGHWGIAWTDATFVDQPGSDAGFQSSP